MRDDELAAEAAEAFSHFDRVGAASEESQRIRGWALSLLCWDGLLPLAVIAAPKVVQFAMPMRQGALEITFVVVPVAAFVLRFVNGHMRFQSGQMYLWQLAVFYLAIFLLFIIDAMLTMAQMVNGPVTSETVQCLCAMYLIYLVLIAVALFPARALPAGETECIQSSVKS